MISAPGLLEAEGVGARTWVPGMEMARVLELRMGRLVVQATSLYLIRDLWSSHEWPRVGLSQGRTGC